MCGTESIKGNLYTCLVCSDIMACENCEKSATHEHTMIEITSEHSLNSNRKIKFFTQLLHL